MGFALAIAFNCLAFTILHSFGELIVLRHPPSPDGSRRNLTCISEDDDAALVWNNNGYFVHTDFQPKKPSLNYIKDCAVWDGRCAIHWENMKNWDVVNTTARPMGPVFDYRWEGFKEINFSTPLYDSIYEYVGNMNASSNTAVFSARGLKDVYIFLCDQKEVTTGQCLWLFFGGWDNTRSGIRFCNKTAPRVMQEVSGNRLCQDLVKHDLRNIINEFEWRTFTIKWIKERKTIQVFRDTRDDPFLQAYVDSWPNISHISVRSLAGTRVRFHVYEYFESEIKGAKISSSQFNLGGKNPCVELPTGLCPECKFKITLVDNRGDGIETWNISGDEKSTHNGMLTWRTVKLNVTSVDVTSNYVRLVIETILKGNARHGRWAIANPYTCQLVGEPRKSTITIHRNTKTGSSHWPQVKCQKLSYSRSAVVDSTSGSTIDNHEKQLSQFGRNLQRFCGPSCTNLGERWSLCSPTGCTCDRGYEGDDCANVCSPGFYGYNCIEKCGSCSGEICDRVNGSCNECKGKTLAPLCKKAFGKPIIVQVTDNSAKLIQKLEVEDDEWTRKLWFKIESLPGNVSWLPLTNSTKSGKLVTYTGDITGLKPDTLYAVYTVLQLNPAKKTRLDSPKVYFKTTYSGKPCFELIPEETKIILKKLSGAKRCENPAYESYSLHFQNTEGIGGITILPSPWSTHVFLNLTPNTNYRLNISVDPLGRTLLWATEVSTLQSAPEKVQNLVEKSVSDTEVTLQWSAPSEKNGIINGYTVSIQREALIGCEVLGRNSPASKKKVIPNVTDTMISINGLHPYAKYKATVIAHTTKSGPPESITFITNQKYIPTSAFDKLRLKDKNLTLEWKEPKDCTTISGTISAAALLITGVSEWARNWTYRMQTDKSRIDLSSIELMPYTSYKAQVYVIRNLSEPENLTCYREQIWMTEPAEPQAVSHFEVYDANFEKKSISLRWKPPYPPRGKIESYHLTSYVDNRPTQNWTINISEGPSTCRIWKKFICLENLTMPSNFSDIKIEIYGKNEGVKRCGFMGSLTFKPDEYFEAPTRPEKFEEFFSPGGVVLLKWKHPFSPTYISEFQISVKSNSTRLSREQPNKNVLPFNYQVREKRDVYNMRLPLAPSTTYNISMVSRNQWKSSAKESKIVEVPNGYGFPEGEEPQAEIIGNLINVAIPGIVNATSNTLVRTVVKGLYQCGNIKSSTQLVSEYKNNVSIPHNFIIDANETKMNNLSCSLIPGEAYVVQAFGVDGSSDKIRQFTIGGSNMLLIVIILSIVLPIFAICLLILCCLCRRRYKIASRRRKHAHAYPKAASSVENLIALFTLKSSTTKRYHVEDRNSDTYAIPYESDSRVVQAAYFPEYAEVAANSGVLLSQYMMFPRDLTKPCQYGRLPQNIEKNRDKNLPAYDDTRVVLNKLPGEPHSDYINASYIQGHLGEKAYIATQGPMPNTLNDFWRMVWQEKVYVICMLTNMVEDGEVKCTQYWPEEGKKSKYGDVSVLVVDRQVFAEYTVRIIRLGCQKYKRKITHLHYTGWPSRGIPTYPQSLVAYLKRLEETPAGNGPLVVHCSTGTGRTGTLILCDICLRQAEDAKVIDVVAATNQMRESRANMVGSSQQYILAHVVIMESLTTATTRVFCTDDLPMQIKKLKKRLPEDFKRLNERLWQDRVLYSLVKPQCPTPGDFRTKRLPMLDSVCPDVIYFERYSTYNTDSNNYIGAVSVDGVRTKKEYLASQLPSSSTWAKFWVIIARRNIELIIILQRSDPGDPTCRDIMPGKSSFAATADIRVERKEAIREEDHLTSEQVLLTNTSKENSTPQPITVLTCTGWERGRNGKPPIPEALVSLWRASGKILRKESRTLVLCHDGVTGCGLYLALSFLLEKMSVERECDVISAVRAVRRFRPEFVQPIEQFEYLYDAAVEYAKCFEIYSNFT